LLWRSYSIYDLRRVLNEDDRRHPLYEEVVRKCRRKPLSHHMDLFIACDDPGVPDTYRRLWGLVYEKWPAGGKLLAVEEIDRVFGREIYKWPWRIIIYSPFSEELYERYGEAYFNYFILVEADAQSGRADPSKMCKVEYRVCRAECEDLWAALRRCGDDIACGARVLARRASCDKMIFPSTG